MNWIKWRDKGVRALLSGIRAAEDWLSSYEKPSKSPKLRKTYRLRRLEDAPGVVGITLTDHNLDQWLVITIPENYPPSMTQHTIKVMREKFGQVLCLPESFNLALLEEVNVVERRHTCDEKE